jgi:hypothetical protein
MEGRQMTTTTFRTAVCVFGASLIVAACNNSHDAADAALDRNLDIANSGGVDQAALRDVGAAGSAQSNTPPPVGTKTKAVAPRTGTVATGAVLVFASNSNVCTHTHKAGDTFQAVLKESVAGTNGAVIPAGSVATVQITSLKRAAKSSETAEMGFRVASIMVNGKKADLVSHVTALEAKQERSARSKDAQKVIGGAVVGAIVGQILGKDTKSTVIGAATGAAAGTVVAMATGDYEGCVPEGGRITSALDAPLIIAVAE